MRKGLLFFATALIAALAATLLLAILALAGPLPQLALTGVEPDTLVSQAGGALSIYGSGFTTATVARLVGYGLLETTYVNSSALWAIVPPGVPVGTYDLELSEAGLSATLPAALTIVAATPTPGPTQAPTPKPTPVPGRPILTVRNFSVEPGRVVAGSEFVVTIEVYNTGSRAGENTLVTFPGGTFIPVDQTGHQLWQLHINHTAVVTQRLRVPGGLASGSYDLRVNLSANDYEGSHYEYPQTIAVEVVGVAQGRPRLAIETARTEPAVLMPGDAFSLTLGLVNLGSRTATQVMIGAANADLAVPAGGSNMVPVGVVGINQSATATLSLVLGDVPYAGRLGLEIAADYSDYDGGSYTARQSVGLEVLTSQMERPELIVTAYRTAPESLAPGDTFTLTIELGNVGGREAQRLALTLGGEGGSEMGPFVPVASGNVKYVSNLAAGAAVEVTQQLGVDGRADPGAYSLPVVLAYDDARGGSYTVRQSVGLEITASLLDRPQLIVTSYSTAPGSLAPGEPFTLAIHVNNIGGGDARQLTLTLGREDGSGMEPFAPLASGNVKYLPHLAAGAEVEVTQRLVADGGTGSGVYGLPVVLAYDDARGTRHTDLQQVSLLLRRRPHLQIGFYRPVEAAPVGVPLELPIEVTNIGRTLVNASMVEVSSVQLEISEGSFYLGPLDGGTSGSFEPTAIAQEGGRAEVVVSVHYLDDFDQPQVISRTLEVEAYVEEPLATATDTGPVQEEEEGKEGFWQKVGRVLRGLLGLGS